MRRKRCASSHYRRGARSSSPSNSPMPTDDVRQAIASGLRTTFTTTSTCGCSLPGWVDRTVATSTVSLSDHYDNLTRRHPRWSTAATRPSSPKTMRPSGSGFTTVTQLPIIRTARLDPARDYYVRISAQARPRGARCSIRQRRASQAKFTLIPSSGRLPSRFGDVESAGNPRQDRCVCSRAGCRAETGRWRHSVNHEERRPSRAVKRYCLQFTTAKLLMRSMASRMCQARQPVGCLLRPPCARRTL